MSGMRMSRRLAARRVSKSGLVAINAYRALSDEDLRVMAERLRRSGMSGVIAGRGIEVQVVRQGCR